LPHVIAQKADFKPQEITSLLWAMAKLGGDGQERTPGLNEAVAALLPHVKAQKNQFNAHCIANLLWAMAKVTDNGHERTPEFRETLVALLPHVLAQKANFKPLEVANLLWAMAKLVDNGQEQTSAFKEAVAALLPHVKAQKCQFFPQQIVILLWAMAKLVNNGQKQTSAFKEAVVALLPLVNAQEGQFNAQHIANLLWAIAKLVDNGQEWTPELEEAVAALLSHVNAQQGQFSTQGIANMMWAMVKLIDSGQEQTPELKEAVAALLPHVNAHKDQFNAQCIANLLWAMASLGEFIELNVVTFMFESLVYRISENPQFSQQEILMSLWGVMVCCARLSLVPNANKINALEKQMDDLFTRLENTSSDNDEDQHIIAMAASWLGRPSPVVPNYWSNISKPQTDFRNQLQLCMPSLKIEEEKSLNLLSPVDLLLPDHNVVIEIQGPTHYVSGDFKTRKGSTLLKIALLKKSGFEVIEVPTSTLWNRDLIKPCIDQIKTRVNISLQG
ncbi:RAP domain-containing protein, partial [Salinisphaera sp. G21_0]|uniref:RAP domain-containing protein n=1 Tax=Salinisphaera sp. G21_0 TaxID=2821094 RepID=UPI001ADC5D1F